MRPNNTVPPALNNFLHMRKIFTGALMLLAAYGTMAQQKNTFNGLDVNLGNIYRLSNAKTRSISPENFTGEPGKGGMATLENGSAAKEARELGQGWKVSPYVVVKKKTTFTLAEMTGPGAVQHIWMTPTGNWRFSILRFYWDDEKNPL